MSRTGLALFVILFGLGGLTALVSLGVWQVNRHYEKTARIAEIEAGLAAAPTEIRGDEDAETRNFTPGVARGRFDAGAEQARYLTSLRPLGPGYRIIAPFVLETGVRILVDRGFAPNAVAPRGEPAPPAPDGAVALTGVLHWPNEASRFTPEPNAADRLWFAREVGDLAAALDTAPVLLVLDAPPAGAAATAGAATEPAWPRPAPVTIDLPNPHAGYAATWFGMAAVWLAMTVVFALRSAGRRPAERSSGAA